MLEFFFTSVVRRRKLVVAVALVMMVLAGAASFGLHQRLTSGWTDWDNPDAPNVLTRNLIESRTGIDVQQGYALLVRVDRPIDPQAEPPAPVKAAIQLLHSRPEVRQILDYKSTQNATLISRNGLSTIVVGSVGHVTESRVVADLEKQVANNPQLKDRVTIGGSSPGNVEVMSVVLQDLAFAEVIVFPLLFVLLIFVFRGVVAAALPLLGGGFSVLITVLVMRVMVEFMTLSVFGLNLVLALGLGLAVDFSLLIVSRFREELRRTGVSLRAIQATMNTAGRTVLYSGLTVGSSLIALLVFPQRFLYSMGVCGMAVVGASLIYALVVLPGLLSLLGDRVEALAPRRWQRNADLGRGVDRSQARWYALAKAVMRRPLAAALLAAALLLLLASPLTGIRFTAVQSPNTLPRNVSAGAVAAAMHDDFAPMSDQESIVISAPAEAANAVAAYAHALRSISGISAVQPPQQLDGQHWLVQVILDEEPNTATARATMHRIYAINLAFPRQITGPTADGLALNADLGSRLPLAAIILITSTLIALFVMTGSLVLPAKAVIMNALSLGAALGLVVFIFQQGHFAHLFGTTAQGALESTSPIILTVVAFGLSTDYGVFLLGRIKEFHDGGATNNEAVTRGIQHTGRIVTSAALLFCIAMAAMVLGRLAFAKELGFGAAAAVVIDATIVRAVLVPSLMALLGNLNWWAPGPLKQLHRWIGVAEPRRERGLGNSFDHTSRSASEPVIATAVTPELSVRTTSSSNQGKNL